MGALTIQCGTKFLPFLILQILQFFQQSAKISSCKQNKNYRKHFPLKIYSNLNSLHKNTVLTEIVSVTLCLLAHSETKRYTMSYWFYLGYPQLTILSMLGSGHFLKITKVDSQQEKPICPNRKN